MTSEPSPSPAQPSRKSVPSLGEVDHLIDRVGIGIVQTVERYYEKYCEAPSEKTAKQYNLWRLRLHRRLRGDTDTLKAINEARNLGLYDEKPGQTFWDCDFSNG